MKQTTHSEKKLLGDKREWGNADHRKKGDEKAPGRPPKGQV